MRPTSRVVLAVLVTALAGSGSSETVTAANVQPCAGPRPLGSSTDGARLILTEGQRVSQELLGLTCVDAADTVSSTPIGWGDGNTSAATIVYHDNADGATKQATVKSAHTYSRATCPRSQASCGRTYAITASLTNDQAGKTFDLRQLVTVLPGPIRMQAEPVRARAGAVRNRPLAALRTAGIRHRGELSVTIRWGDGHSGHGRITGTGRRFVIRGSHRWRHPGISVVALTCNDAFGRQHHTLRMTVRVSRR